MPTQLEMLKDVLDELTIGHEIQTIPDHPEIGTDIVFITGGDDSIVYTISFDKTGTCIHTSYAPY